MNRKPEVPATRPIPQSFDLLAMDRQIRRRITRGRALHAAAWVGLVAIGLRKGGLLGWLGTAAGMFALVREVLVWRQQRPEWQRTCAGTSLRRRLMRSGVDPIDRASATSFPASDAPSN